MEFTLALEFTFSSQQNSQKQSNLIVTKLKLVNLNYILDYKLVIEKILKLVIRQVLMIYMLYSALKSMLYLHIVHNFKTCFIYFQQFLV